MGINLLVGAHFSLLENIYIKRINKINNMKYLKKFENHAAYEAAESGLILPNVSLCAQENEVHYKPYVPPIIDDHEYVDLGLPSSTKWATMNVGATTVSGATATTYGNYYQYGKGADQYAVTSGQSDYNGMENPLASSADTATQVWGGRWHTPTSTQWQELIDECTWTWEFHYNGGKTNVYKVTSKTDESKYILLPAGGNWSNGEHFREGAGGSYRSSVPYDSSNTYDLYFNSSNKYVGNNPRNYGMTIRPVVG